MRIIFLNSWFGKAGKPYFDFVKNEASRTDIFCFMEYSQELFDKVSKILKKHNGFIEKGMLLKSWNVVDSQVIFARNNLEVASSGQLNIYKNNPNDTGFASYIIFKHDGEIINLLNVHGKARPGTKLDNPTRLKQSRIIIDFMKDKPGIKIIGGDFNLELKTKSVEMFEEAGYRNLIKDFDIKNTRNELSWRQFGQFSESTRQHFADFCFVSPEVKVKSFEVPYMEISDHLPLILEAEI